jgi:hypothetical protein
VTENEAAERLRKRDPDGTTSYLLDKALAAERRAGLEEGIRRTLEEVQSKIVDERRATVERIQKRVIGTLLLDVEEHPAVTEVVSRIHAILDGEAAR